MKTSSNGRCKEDPIKSRKAQPPYDNFFAMPFIGRMSDCLTDDWRRASLFEAKPAHKSSKPPDSVRFCTSAAADRQRWCRWW